MIYKYFAPTSHTLENISKRQLIARHYSQFNDPFEFWARVRSGLPNPALEPDRHQEAIRIWGSDEQEARATAEYFEELAESAPDFNLLYDHTRIACFAASPANLLLWSHYADGLRGLCIGFDEKLLTARDDAYFTPVRYSDHPPVVDSFLYSVAEDQRDYHAMAIDELRRAHPELEEHAEYRRVLDESQSLMEEIWASAFASKPACWSYEQELRLLVRVDNGDTTPDFVRYPAEAVLDIVIGDRMPELYSAEIEAAARTADLQAAIRTAGRTSDSYDLRIL